MTSRPYSSKKPSEVLSDYLRKVRGAKRGYDKCRLPRLAGLINIEKLVKENLAKYGDEYEEEGMYLLDSYCFAPEMRFYRFARNYSEACPEGELGDFHISIGLGTIPREVFEELKRKSFRVD